MISQADMIEAPIQLTRPGDRTGDSGTKRNVVTVAPMDRTRGIQNSQWYERCSMIGPARTIPVPTPTPRMAESTPMAPATFSGGNSSRMIPKASGKTAPPAPWTIRPASMIGKVVARALIRVPTDSVTSTTTIIFSLPTMSPIRPRIGVAIAALSR